MHKMAQRDAKELPQDPQAPPTGNAMQEPPRSAGNAGSTDDTGTHRGEDVDRWMDKQHLGSDHSSDHGTNAEYNHGGAPPRVI
jgi:hypothetical protein